MAVELHIGFTGTRFGMTPEQRHSLRNVLSALSIVGGVRWFHHGDCIGADAEAHEVAKAQGFKIHVHPPDNDKLRALLLGDRIAELKPYKVRNGDIVRSTLWLIACPRTYGPKPHSGTWGTVTLAKKHDKPIVIIRPDGSIEMIGVCTHDEC